jgi:hypothetical protein
LEYVPAHLFIGYKTLFISSIVTGDTYTPLYKNNRERLVKDVNPAVLSSQLPT